MSGWIMGIVGVICLSVLVDILLPDGQTNKYIKGIFALITLYVIISPLPAFLSKDYSLDEVLSFDAVEFAIDDDFLDGISTNPFKSREDALAAYLTKCGYANTSVRYVSRVENSAEVDYINVYLTKASLPTDVSHSVVSENVKSLAADFSGIEKEDIRVLYG